MRMRMQCLREWLMNRKRCAAAVQASREIGAIQLRLRSRGCCDLRGEGIGPTIYNDNLDAMTKSKD